MIEFTAARRGNRKQYRVVCRSAFRLLPLLFVASWAAAVSGEDLFSNFEPGWQSSWTERGLAPRQNVFHLEEAGDNRCLRVESMGSASALLRPLDVALSAETSLSWRWKVDRSLRHIEDARRRDTDDYAARVAVMFDGEPFENGTSFIMYVWAGSESIGDVYPSPYTKMAATIVLQSGDGRSGEWVRESRELTSDFEHFFKRKPIRVTGVALLVDTDNTDSKATSWFDDLTLSKTR